MQNFFERIVIQKRIGAMNEASELFAVACSVSRTQLRASPLTQKEKAQHTVLRTVD